MSKIRETLQNIGKIRLSLIIALIIGVIGVLLNGFDFGVTIEGKFFDAQYLLKEEIGPLPEDEVIIVAIDDQSLASLQVVWPWPRTMYAKAINNLSRAGAHVVAFDLMFSEAKTGEKKIQDKILGDAIVASRAWIILGSKFYTERTNRGIRTSYIASVSTIDPGKTHVGYVNYWADSDGVIRHAALLRKHQGQLHQSFVLKILSRYKKLNAPMVTLTKKWLTYGSEKIRVENDAKMIINYRGGTGRFKTIPFENIVDDEIFNGMLELGLFKNKIILIGPTFTEAQDNHVTPYFRGRDERNAALGKTPGVEIHANVLNTILQKDYFQTVPVGIKVLLFFFLPFILAFFTIGLRPIKGFLVFLGTCLVYFGFSASMFIGFKMVFPVFIPLLTLLTAFLMALVYRLFTEEFQNRRIRGMFSRYVSPKVVDQLVKNPLAELQLGGNKQEVTVLFSDIRGFTSMSENMPPEQVVDRLNEYFQVWTDMIFKYDGMVDKFIGDAVMAIFGAPVAHSDDPERAVRCALEMNAALEKMQDRWQAEGKHVIKIGVGINTGEAIVGNMGSQQAMGYTVIGDTVNVASRLESKTKELKQTLLISESTYQAVKHLVDVVEFDDVTVKGKARALSVFGVKGLKK